MVATMKVKIKFDKFEQIKKVAPQKAGRALRALAYEGLAHAKLLIDQSPADGRSYQRGGKTHVASSPGNPPRSDSGTLYNSLHVYREGAFKQILADGVEYGVYLEFGTENMAPRPFMGPTVLHLEEVAPDVFDDFLD